MRHAHPEDSIFGWGVLFLSELSGVMIQIFGDFNRQRQFSQGHLHGVLLFVSKTATRDKVATLPRKSEIPPRLARDSCLICLVSKTSAANVMPERFRPARPRFADRVYRASSGFLPEVRGNDRARPIGRVVI